MAQHAQDSSICEAVELLQDNGFDALAEAVTVLMNTAMVAERSEYFEVRSYRRRRPFNPLAAGIGRCSAQRNTSTIPPADSLPPN